MAVMSFELATSGGTMANVETMTTTPNMAPASTFSLFAEQLITVSGAETTRGFPVAIWTWGFIPLDMFTALRVICSGPSASVKIRTLKEDYTTYAYYTAILHWPTPDSYEYRGGIYRPFQIRFTNLVSYTP